MPAPAISWDTTNNTTKANTSALNVKFMPFRGVLGIAKMAVGSEGDERALYDRSGAANPVQALGDWFRAATFRRRRVDDDDDDVGQLTLNLWSTPCSEKIPPSREVLTLP